MSVYKKYMCVNIICIIFFEIYACIYIYKCVYINVLVCFFLKKKTGQISYQLNKWHQCPSLHWCLWLRTKSQPLGVNQVLWISSHTFFLRIERERKQKPCHIPSSWASGGKCHGTRSNSKHENENRKLLETGIGVSSSLEKKVIRKWWREVIWKGNGWLWEVTQRSSKSGEQGEDTPQRRWSCRLKK